MISPQLLALVRCPECHGRARRATASRSTCRGCGRAVPRPVRRLPRPASVASNSPSRRSTWTRRCTPTRGTSASRRRCSDRRSATTCCARSSPRRPGDRGRRSRVRQRPGAAVERRLAAQRTVGDRHQPVLRRGSARAAWTCCSATCGACPSRTAPSRRRTRSTCSSTCRRRRCAACSPKPARVLAPGGALVRLLARPQERADRGRAALDQRARAAAREARADRHAPGAAAQVGSPQPAAGHP